MAWFPFPWRFVTFQDLANAETTMTAAEQADFVPLAARVTVLETQVAELQAEVAALQSEVAALELFFS